MRVLPLLLALSACSEDERKPSDADADSDVDTDADSDSDADADIDWDAGVDAGYEDCLGRCTGGLLCCDDAFGASVRGCTEPVFDVHNCGSCGNQCRDDEVCWEGTCACPGGECGGVCVDLTWDWQNCGVCGVVCGGATPICFLGSCRSCEGGGGLSCPGGECPRVIEDEENCGGCGIDCDRSEQCVGGSCVGGECGDDCRDAVCCDNPWGGDAAGCTNIEWDNANCGACGVWCGDTERCIRGACVAQECDTWCDFGQNCCDQVWGGDEGCTSVEWDPGNCGGCGIVCADGEVCAEGICRNP